MTRPIYSFKRGPARAKAPRAHPEQDAQIAMVQYIEAAKPDDMMFTATLNGVPLGHKTRETATAMGMRSGALDLLFVWSHWAPSNTKWIEVKVNTGLSPTQRKWIIQAGPENCAVAKTLEDVYGALIEWGVPLKCKPVHPSARRYLSRDPNYLDSEG